MKASIVDPSSIYDLIRGKVGTVDADEIEPGEQYAVDFGSDGRYFAAGGMLNIHYEPNTRRYVTKDSGARSEYDTGMVRDTQDGKPRFDLILPEGVPFEEQMLTRLAALLARGAEKYTIYGDCNCGANTQNVGSTHSGSADHAMSANYVREIQGTPSVNVTMQGSGRRETSSESQSAIRNTESVNRSATERTKRTGYPENNTKSTFLSPAESAEPSPYTSTTTIDATQMGEDAQSAYAGASATDAILVSATTKDGSPKIEMRHSHGCPALQVKVQGERNWEKAATPEELARFKSSLFRHTMQYLCGEEDEDHAAAILFNVLGAETTKYRMRQQKDAE